MYQVNRPVIGGCCVTAAAIANTFVNAATRFFVVWGPILDGFLTLLGMGVAVLTIRKLVRDGAVRS